MADNLVKMLPKALNKYSIDTVIKYCGHMIQSCYFNLTSVSNNSIMTILKTTQVSKAPGLDNLSWYFLKDEAKVLAKAINNLCNLSINSEKYPDFCKVAKRKPLCKRGSLTQPFSYRPLLPLVSKVIEKTIHDQTSTFLNSKNLLYFSQSGFTNLVLKKFNRFLSFLFE